MLFEPLHDIMGQIHEIDFSNLQNYSCLCCNWSHGMKCVFIGCHFLSFIHFQMAYVLAYVTIKDVQAKVKAVSLMMCCAKLRFLGRLSFTSLSGRSSGRTKKSL